MRVVAVLLCLCGVACDRGGDAVQELVGPEPVVQVVRVAEPRGQAVIVAGRIMPDERRALAFPQAGHLVGPLVPVGRLVQAGAVLARMDDSALQERLQSARLALTQARQDLRRVQGLQADAALQRPDVDAAQRRLTAARAAVLRLEEAVASCILRAPFGGRISAVHVPPAATVAAAEPVVDLEDVDHLQLCLVPPPAIAQAVAGLDQAALLARLDVTVVIAGGLRLQAQAVELPVPVRDEQPWCFALRAPGVRSGGGGELTAHVQVAPPAGVLIPMRAVVIDAAGGSLVWRVHGDPPRVQAVPVSVAETAGDTVRVQRGIAPGDRIVVAGQAGLRAGMRVRVQQEVD